MNLKKRIIALNKEKSNLLISKKPKEKSNNKMTLIKSFSNRNIKLSKNLKLDSINSTKSSNTILNLKNYKYKYNSLGSIFNIEKKKKLPKIRTYEKIISRINKKLAKQKNYSFFITDRSGVKVNKSETRLINFRKKNAIKKRSHFKEYLNYNVFNEKDIEFKDLIMKFDKQVAKKKLNKMVRRKNILNKLYGISPGYLKTIKYAKSQKHLSLEEYQDNIISAYNSNGMFSNESLSELYKKFNNIKTEIESVTPFPKIEISHIVKHFKRKLKKKNNKVMSLKDFLSKEKGPMDEFEKEEHDIIQLKLKKNSHLPKIKHDKFNSLPSHIKNLFSN